MSRAKTQTLGTPGAIESNAGDDYHILWACRRALRLLEPDRSLSLVCIEGVSREDEITVADPDAFLGVDLTEYYGGAASADATRVVFSQLKYSQRHPERPWTAARLCERPKGARERSIIARLAQAFSGFHEGRARTLVIERLRIKLVSNRPADEALVHALDAAQAWLKDRPETQAARLLAALPVSSRDVVHRLQQASGLASTAFCDFLRCLDLSDCNSDGRLWQRLRLIEEIGRIAPASPAERARDLYERVASEALPRVGELGLRRNDVLAALGCHGKGSLFPAPPSFECLSNPIPTPDADRILEALRTSPFRSLLAHGAGGVGKTSTVLSLPDHWPHGRWVFYDCFGAGTYKDSPGDERHSVRRALLQLSNELAVQCGSPFLIRPPDGKDDLWRAFRTRLDAAADILQKQGAALVLVIDAADNAIQAADTPEDSFVVDLWKVPRPENVFLLMTARSGGRAQSLQAPSGTPQLELTGFNLEASAQHLRRSYPLATDEDTAAFHLHSHGNPRVQNYALNTGVAAEIPTVLSHARRNLDDIFKDYVEGALTLRFSWGRASDHLDDLSCFPRPLRLDHLTEVSGLPAAELEALCNALSPGLTRDADGWRFRDEDFDTFLRVRLEEAAGAPSAHRRLAQRMAALPDSDFAARHRADHLFKAEDDAAMIALALAGHAAIPRHMDEVAQVQVLRRRLVLGVKAAARAGQAEALVRLTVQAADVARSDYAILKLIEEHPDLAALYADPQTIAKHYLTAENQAWFGGVQLRCAALFSRDPENHVRAREHMNMARAWLRRRAAKRQEERGHWEIKPHHIAAGAEAVFRFAGPETANRWLSGWRPLDFVLHVCRVLADAIARDVPPPRQTELFHALRPHPLAAVLFLVAFHRAGAQPEAPLVEAVLSAMEAYSRLKRHPFLYERHVFNADTLALRAAVGVEFAELLAAYGIAPERISRLLERLSPLETNFAPRDGHDASRFIPQLRVLALLAELNGKAPDEQALAQRLLKFHEETPEYERGEERQRFHTMVGARFQLYRLRAEAVIDRPASTDLLPRLTEALNRGTAERWRYGRDFDFYLSDALPPLAEAALACTGEIGVFLDTLAEAMASKFGDGAPTYWISLAARLLTRHDQIRRGLALLDRAAGYLAEHPTNGQEHCEALLRAAALAQPHDPAMGADFFHQAVNVARELNDDLCDRLRYLAGSAEGLKNDLDESEARDLSARLVRLAEETHIYVTNEDAYPWERVFRAVLGLHTPSGYALFVRWADLGHLGIRSSTGELSQTALDEGRLQPGQALGLLRLGWSGRGTADAFVSMLDVTLAQRGVSSDTFRNLLGCVVHWVLRDISRDERAACARRLQAWLSTNHCGHLPEGQPLREYLAFVAAHPRQETAYSHPQQSHWSEQSPSEQVDWDLFFGQAPIPARLPALLAGLRELPGYQGHGTFYEQVRQRLSPSERPAYLQALLELPDTRLYSDEYLNEWEICLNSWRHAYPVQRWAVSGMPELVRRHLPGLLGYPYHVDEHLARLSRLPFVKLERWLDLLAPALADWVERLGAWQLYPLAGVLAAGLGAEQRKTLLEEAIVHGERALEERQQKPLPPLPAWQVYGEDRAAPFATLLHTLLGHPDTRIRWSCLHALRDMDLQHAPALLAALIGRLDAEHVDGFLPADSYFLWMSARAYLMIFLARFALDHPAALRPHVETLLRHALSRDFPHVQIRELAKRTLLAVEDVLPGTLDAETRLQIEAVNQPVAVHVIEGMRRHLSDARNYEGRFDFNSLDTLPYWYAPLGRRFNLGGDEVAVLAEKWICDRWGVFGHTVPQPGNRGHDRDWHLTRNDHGSLPIIEEGRTYLEYHAMLLVAGELIDSRPNTLRSPDSSYDRWEYWLQSHLPTHSRCWLSELRAPVPLEAQLHGLATPQEDWLKPTVPSAFDHCLGLRSSGNNDCLIVAAAVDIHESGRRERHRIESALVSPQSAHALLRALQAIGDPTPYRIPPAGHDLEIDEPGFSLRGWIAETSVEKELDGHDPLLYGMDTDLPRFPQTVQEALHVQPDPTGKRYLDRSDPHRLIAEITAWSDPHEDREGAEYSAGWRLQIRLDRLLGYLQAQQRCLMLEVQIDRKERRHGQEKNIDYQPPAVLLYLLHPSGHLETLEHHHRLGPTDT
ncbi:ATP-binding protein [Pseudothauera rhizosphaerae]|uniref:ATP-binding protein n=1 Tax=Pseudothauera rhizosphaerae TaxID=2565932 RepID=A0A4S4ALK9_9RHOO|nr:ATP-binding protein [Pseudothauera rhizosphaerae]THF60379.1 ATP-binding protein [Pseudothauera rhizosphaerae]